MMTRLYHLPYWIVRLIAIGLLSACGQNAQAPASLQPPPPISEQDECHVCGMFISGFPGPKAQAFIRGRQQPVKFCSTVELFSWLLQPDTTAMVQIAYVQDMQDANWAQPQAHPFIAAAQAYYVFGHSLPGAMGPTLASFANAAAAEKFQQRFGGQILRFSDINLSLLAQSSADNQPTRLTPHRHE